MPVDPILAKRIAEWQRVRPMVEKALDVAPRIHSILDIEEGIVSGRMMFWAGRECVVITRLDICASRIFTIMYVGGDIAEAMHGVPELRRMAALMNCDYMLVEVPAEHLQAALSLGFTPAWTLLKQEVDPAWASPAPRAYGTGTYGSGAYGNPATEPADAEKDKIN